MTRRLRWAVAIMACSASAFLGTACSSSSTTPSASGSSGTPASSASPNASSSGFLSTIQREDQLYPVFVQCLAQHNIPVWTKATGNVSVSDEGTKDGWYADGKVTTNDAWYRWIDSHNGMYPMSSELKPDLKIDQWVDNAAQRGLWPSNLCGPLPAA